MSNRKNSNRETQNSKKINADTYDLDTCTSDPGWAEHARPNDMGPEPCDDGRGIKFNAS
ncbi:hypothetical protein [uncultured Desulfobacter sp.]|uniref:hypothetical protein n=1 Tax=uncultured Desulfobacter sp. TaxID=240139 RepID=UPI0029F4D455|nr:hypothetical protein [uncultured Desulfobacter sp.]